MSDLIDCPFCGSEPKEGPQNPKDAGDAWRFIRCGNDLCAVRPEVTVREDSCAGPDGEGPWLDSPAEIREEAKRRWNARHNEPAQPDSCQETKYGK